MTHQKTKAKDKYNQFETGKVISELINEDSIAINNQFDWLNNNC